MLLPGSPILLHPPVESIRFDPLEKRGAMLLRMAIFFVKLIPPRASFPADMSEDERALMQQHATYMQQHFEAGRVLIYGPVMHAAGAFGVAVLDLPDEAEARRLLDSDPTVAAGLTKHELSPMQLGGAQGMQRQAGVPSDFA